MCSQKFGRLVYSGSQTKIPEVLLWLLDGWSGFVSALVRCQYMAFCDAFIGFGWSLACSSNCLILSAELYINTAL